MRSKKICGFWCLGLEVRFYFSIVGRWEKGSMMDDGRKTDLADEVGAGGVEAVALLMQVQVFLQPEELCEFVCVGWLYGGRSQSMHALSPWGGLDRRIQTIHR